MHQLKSLTIKEKKKEKTAWTEIIYPPPPPQKKKKKKKNHLHKEKRKRKQLNCVNWDHLKKQMHELSNVLEKDDALIYYNNKNKT